MRLESSIVGEAKVIKLVDIAAARAEAEQAALSDARAQEALRTIQAALNALSEIRKKSATNDTKIMTPALMKRQSKHSALKALYTALPRPKSKPGTWSARERLAFRLASENADRLIKAIDNDLAKLAEFVKSIKDTEHRGSVKEIFDVESIALKMIKDRIKETKEENLT